MMNIPIYRALKIGTENEWVEGYYSLSKIDRDMHLIQIDETFWEDTGLVYRTIEIDPTTLSIHFNNMIDKNGKKIFASLSEDGVGGDIVLADESNGLIKIDDFNTVIFGDNGYARLYELFADEISIEVIGIYKG